MDYLKLLLIVRYFGASYGCYRRDSPQRKSGTKMSECMSMQTFIETFCL